MPAVVYAFLSTLGALFRSQLSLRVENGALRHQLAVYQRTVKRPRIRPEDRVCGPGCRVAGQGGGNCWSSFSRRPLSRGKRKRFRDHWARVSKAGKSGRPPMSEEIRELIRKISGANPLWGTPRIVGELRKLGIKVAKSTVDKYRVRSRKPPSPTWKRSCRIMSKTLCRLIS